MITPTETSTNYPQPENKFKSLSEVINSPQAGGEPDDTPKDDSENPTKDTPKHTDTKKPVTEDIPKAPKFKSLSELYDSPDDDFQDSPESDEDESEEDKGL